MSRVYIVTTLYTKACNKLSLYSPLRHSAKKHRFVVASVPSPYQLKWRDTSTKRGGNKTDKILLIKMTFFYNCQNCINFESSIGMGVCKFVGLGGNRQPSNANRVWPHNPQNLAIFTTFFKK